MIFPLGKISVDLIGDQVFYAFIEKDRDMSIDNCIVYDGDFVIPSEEKERNSALFQDFNHD